MADSALVKEDEDSKEVKDSKEAEVGRLVVIGCCGVFCRMCAMGVVWVELVVSVLWLRSPS